MESRMEEKKTALVLGATGGIGGPAGAALRPHRWGLRAKDPRPRRRAGGRAASPLWREHSPQRPLTRKGAIRAEMERRLREAAENGVRTLIVRAGDFFGPRGANNWFSQGLVRPGRPLGLVTYPGKAGVGHAWAYLPDLAETMAQLAGRDAALGAFETFHFGGHWDADGTQIVAAVRRVIGNPTLS